MQAAAKPGYSGQCKRDLKAAQKRGKDMEKIKRLIRLLIEGKPLPPEYRDHPLKGNWRSFRDARIEPGLLLIYKLSSDVVRFERTGWHTTCSASERAGDRLLLLVFQSVAPQLRRYDA